MIRRGNATGQRGSVAMIAIITMVVVFILAIGLLSLGNSVRLSGKRQITRSGALTMANAGIEYGFWQSYYRGASLPQTFSLNSSRNGFALKFTVVVTDNSTVVPGTIKLVSTGTQNRESRTVTRVMVAYTPTAFDYALCSNSNLSVAGPVVTGASGANGDIQANGNLSLKNIATKVNGDATAAGTISVTSVTGTATPGAPTAAFPALDTSTTGPYYLNAGRRFLSSQNWSGFSFQPPNADGTFEVVYVNGSVTLRPGTYTGSGTIVATGTITLAGTVAPTFPSDKMAFLSTSGFSFTSSGPVTGFLYADNGSDTAGLSGGAGITPTVTSGSLAADTVSAGAVTVTHDPAMNVSLGRQLHLPGY